MQDHELDIEDWKPPPPMAAPVLHTKQWLPDFRVIGLLGTICFHAIVFQSFLLGSHVHKKRPPEAQGVGATSMKSEAPPTETLVLIELPSASMNDNALVEDLTSFGPKANETMVTLLSSDPLPHIEIPVDRQSEEEDSEAAVNSGDPSARAAMFGRYTGQIDARIERAWHRPRSPVTQPDASRRGGNSSIDDLFRCQVRIIQDEHGKVQEVQMLSCNGSVVWQQSLVAAILSASPLPAPPTPDVFTQVITMTFTADQYNANSPMDGY